MQSVARWLELLAFGVYVFDLTQSPLQVTLVTLVKLAPLFLFGPLGGALPSRWPLRSLYLAGILFALLVTGVSLLLALSGSLMVWQVMIISFLGGLFWVLDFPVRRSLIGDAVPGEQLGRAMGMDTIANNGTRMLGPLLGGVLLQFGGLEGVFILSLCLYVLCFLLTLSLKLGREVVQGTTEGGFAGNMREALQVVRNNPQIFATLLVTVIYNLFGFPMLSLVPVLGRDEFQLSASIIGLLASMEGAGALLGGILFLCLGRISWYRRIYVFGLAAVLLFGLVYAGSGSVLLVAGALLFVGVGSACFAAMQTTLLILNSSAQHRSQIFGLLSVSIGAGLIGFTQIGLMASWLGTRQALAISAICGLLSLAFTCIRWPSIVALQTVDQKRG